MGGKIKNKYEFNQEISLFSWCEERNKHRTEPQDIWFKSKTTCVPLTALMIHIRTKKNEKQLFMLFDVKVIKWLSLFLFILVWETKVKLIISFPITSLNWKLTYLENSLLRNVPFILVEQRRILTTAVNAFNDIEDLYTMAKLINKPIQYSGI